MSKVNDGGFAYPSNDYKVGDYMTVPSTNHGMSLRDYFAGQALAGMGWVCPTEEACASKAKQAYAVADAMLKERAK